MEKRCPVCGAVFECRHDDILKCKCSEVKLSKEELAFIKANYDVCLCFDCLTAVKKRFSDKK